MYVSEDIRWMQISDLHIGSTEYSWTDKTLKERLGYMLNEGKIPRLQFIILTGDIIDRGQIHNIENIDELNQFLDVISPFADKIIITPGNHDYNRNEPRFVLLQNWKKERNKKDNEQSYSSKLAVDFEGFVKIFENRQGVSLSTHSDILCLDGLNIVSLNTSVFSGQPKLDVNGKIVYGDHGPKIEDNGFIWICENDMPDFKKLNTSNPTIMIGHHPLEMFDSSSRARLMRFCKESKIRHYFCGHMHEMQTIVEDTLTQHTSAGLFKDSYNIPSFAVYSIKKSANETIEEDKFYWNGDWEPLEMENEPKKISLEATQFTIPPSEISDGAIRIPYQAGKFNIYVSKDEPSSIVIPHKHDDVEEVTYVSKGALFIVIEDTPYSIRAGEAMLMPKGKYHALIPAQFPCEYLTMSVEAEHHYNTDWQTDINTIRQIDEKLRNGEYGLEKYNEIIKFLGSSIMEVRWEAEEVLNKRLVKENDMDNDYIREAVGTKIRPALRSKDFGDQYFGLSIAYELGIEVSDQEVIDLLKSENYMVTWVCAYYVLKIKKSLDLQKVYHDIPEERVYQRAILAVMQLISGHDGKLLRDNYVELETQCLKYKCLSLTDIIFYFTMWYTSFTYMDQELDYSKASTEFQRLFNGDGEQILRGFTNVQDTTERYQQLLKCNGYNHLLDSVCAYFESISTVREGDMMTDEKNTKERIENYLRIIVSEKCNLQCVYCHHEGRIDSLIGKDVKYNENFNLRDLLKKAKELHFQKIKISGGEPLLYPNILSICNGFQNDFEDIGFTTNGTQISRLKDELKKIEGSRLTFNVTLNSLDHKKNAMITGADEMQNTKEGIEYLVEHNFSVKLNSVITSYNFDEITELISYAARLRINIKLLDLFAIEGTPDEFKHVSIAEIKNEVMKKFRLKDSDFIRKDDYAIAQVMGIQVMIPSRIYSVDCQYNCKMYPCAEGIFGIRVYEDYSCAKCFSGRIYRGTLSELPSNIAQIRKELNSMRFSY